MLGFLPGFAYLGSRGRGDGGSAKCDAEVNACERDRWASPDAQTAVYPSRLSGRLADHRPHVDSIFNAASWPAALLSPGDSVRFRPRCMARRRTRPRSGPAKAATAARSISIIDPGSLDHDAGRRSMGTPVERCSRQRCDGLDRIPYRERACRQRPDGGRARSDAGRSEAAIRTADLIRRGGRGPGATLDGHGCRIASPCPAAPAASFVLEIAARRTARTSRSTVASWFRRNSEPMRLTSCVLSVGLVVGQSTRAIAFALGAKGHQPLARGEPEATAYARGWRCAAAGDPGPAAAITFPPTRSTLLSDALHVSPQSNRMGYRLREDGSRDASIEHAK